MESLDMGSTPSFVVVCPSSVVQVRRYTILQSFGRHQVDQIADTAGVSPLVVIPGDHLDAVAADDQGHVRVDDGGAGVSFEIGRNQFVLLEPEVALQRA